MMSRKSEQFFKPLSSCFYTLQLQSHDILDLLNPNVTSFMDDPL